MKFGQTFFRILLLTMGVGSFSIASAGFVRDVEVRNLYVASGHVLFGPLGTAPGNTCAYFNRAWRFDVMTPQGEAMLKVLLSAQATKSTVSIWYTDSTTPGKNHISGCNQGTMAVPFGLGFSD